MRILKARFRDAESFLGACTADHPYGGVFCPTTTSLDEGEELLVEIGFPHLPNKTLLRGTVVSWRSAIPRLRVRAGAFIAFAASENDKWRFLIDVAQGKREGAIKRRHARVPIVVPCRWRLADATETLEANLRDISIGGAQLLTKVHLDPDDDVVIELTTPGGARPISIAGKVQNSVPDGYGLRFIYRDGGGSRRLREVVRRLTEG